MLSHPSKFFNFYVGRWILNFHSQTPFGLPSTGGVLGSSGGACCADTASSRTNHRGTASYFDAKYCIQGPSWPISRKDVSGWTKIRYCKCTSSILKLHTVCPLCQGRMDGFMSKSDDWVMTGVFTPMPLPWTSVVAPFFWDRNVSWHGQEMPRVCCDKLWKLQLVSSWLPSGKLT